MGEKKQKKKENLRWEIERRKAKAGLFPTFPRAHAHLPGAPEAAPAAAAAMRGGAAAHRGGARFYDVAAEAELEEERRREAAKRHALPAEEKAEIGQEIVELLDEQRQRKVHHETKLLRGVVKKARGHLVRRTVRKKKERGEEGDDGVLGQRLAALRDLDLEQVVRRGLADAGLASKWDKAAETWSEPMALVFNTPAVRAHVDRMRRVRNQFASKKDVIARRLVKPAAEGGDVRHAAQQQDEAAQDAADAEWSSGELDADGNVDGAGPPPRDDDSDEDEDEDEDDESHSTDTSSASDSDADGARAAMRKGKGKGKGKGRGDEADLERLFRRNERKKQLAEARAAKPKKNRPSQHMRQLLAEQKYGKEAIHLLQGKKSQLARQSKKVKEAVYKARDAEKGIKSKGKPRVRSKGDAAADEVGGDARARRTARRAAAQAAKKGEKGEAAPAPAKGGKTEFLKEEEMHPSWQAKRKQAAQANAMQAFAGKRMRLGSDSD